MILSCVLVKLPFPISESTLLELDQQYRQCHEDADPDERGDETVINGRVRDVPASGQHRPHRLRALRQRQQEADVLEGRVHALDRPDDAAEHHDR